MMIIVNRLGDMITGSVNGTTFGVTFNEVKYQQMLALRDKAESEETDTMEKLQAIVAEFVPLTQESFKELVQTASPYIYVNKGTNKFYLKYGEIVSRNPLPQVLVDKILKSLEKGIDITPLVKCWARYMRPVKGRPSYSEARAKLFAEYISATYTDDVQMADLIAKEGFTEEVARAKCTTTQVAITQEGLLVGYKASREITTKYVKNTEQDGGVREVKRYDYVVDEFTGETKDVLPVAEDRIFEPPVVGSSYDAFLCSGTLGHIMRVGCVIELEHWDQVNCNDNASCVKGLHVGGLRYIQGYSNTPGNVTHNIYIDPMDIGAIVGLGYGNDGAMRVRRYFMASTFAGANKSIYHSSKYAALTDADYANLVKEAVEETQMKKADLDKMLQEDGALQVVSKDSKDGVPATNAGTVFGQ